MQRPQERSASTSSYYPYLTLCTSRLPKGLLSLMRSIDPACYPHFDLYPVAAARMPTGVSVSTSGRSRSPYTPWQQVWPYRAALGEKTSASQASVVSESTHSIYPYLNICMSSLIDEERVLTCPDPACYPHFDLYPARSGEMKMQTIPTSSRSNYPYLNICK
jgi:hypothetical protein